MKIMLQQIEQYFSDRALSSFAEKLLRNCRISFLSNLIVLVGSKEEPNICYKFERGL